MKKLLAITARLLLLFLIAVLFSCKFLDFDDPLCDDFVRPEKDVSINATVHVLDADNQPIADQELNFFIYKEPCGEDASKGLLDFSGPTDEQGTRQTPVAFFQLRNAEDKVTLDVYAVKLGNGSIKDDMEFVSYKYDDFIAGSTKEVHVYIYRKF